MSILFSTFFYTSFEASTVSGIQPLTVPNPASASNSPRSPITSLIGVNKNPATLQEFESLIEALIASPKTEQAIKEYNLWFTKAFGTFPGWVQSSSIGADHNRVRELLDGVSEKDKTYLYMAFYAEDEKHHMTLGDFVLSAERLERFLNDLNHLKEQPKEPFAINLYEDQDHTGGKRQTSSKRKSLEEIGFWASLFTLPNQTIPAHATALHTIMFLLLKHCCGVPYLGYRPFFHVAEAQSDKLDVRYVNVCMATEKGGAQFWIDLDTGEQKWIKERSEYVQNQCTNGTYDDFIKAREGFIQQKIQEVTCYIEKLKEISSIGRSEDVWKKRFISENDNARTLESCINLLERNQNIGITRLTTMSQNEVITKAQRALQELKVSFELAGYTSIGNIFNEVSKQTTLQAMVDSLLDKALNILILLQISETRNMAQKSMSNKESRQLGNKIKTINQNHALAGSGDRSQEFRSDLCTKAAQNLIIAQLDEMDGHLMNEAKTSREYQKIGDPKESPNVIANMIQHFEALLKSLQASQNLANESTNADYNQIIRDKLLAHARMATANS